MNKAEITKVVAEKLGVTQVRAAEIIVIVFTAFLDAAKQYGRCIFSPWKFEKKIREERQGRNPRTGESITIGQKEKITFKVFGE